MAGVLFNVNPKTGPSPSQKALADRIMHGSGRAVDNAHHYGGPKSGKPIGVPQVRQAAINGVANHHADVAPHGNGGGGNPNHDEHGRFA